MKTFCFVLAALSLTTVAYAQQTTTTTVITVTDARPLAEAILKLEKVSGQVITYDDAPYVYAGDLEDKSDTYRHAPGVKVMLPKRGALLFPYQMSEVSDRAGTGKALLRLVTTFNKTYPDGAQYTVLDRDGMFYVFPKTSRSEKGTVGPFTSPLDVPITVVVKEVNGEVALKAIQDAIHEATGIKIFTGGWYDFSRAKSISISSQQETARTVLTQFLQVAGPEAGYLQPISWSLLTGGMSGPLAYFLNPHEVIRR